MSAKSLRSREAILRKVESERAAGRPFGGFAFAFCAGIARALQRPNEAEVLLTAIKAAEPPTHCPACGHACSFPARDASGDWTWKCPGGCNP